MPPSPKVPCPTAGHRIAVYMHHIFQARCDRRGETPLPVGWQKILEAFEKCLAQIVNREIERRACVHLKGRNIYIPLYEDPILWAAAKKSGLADWPVLCERLTNVREITATETRVVVECGDDKLQTLWRR